MLESQVANLRSHTGGAHSHAPRRLAVVFWLTFSGAVAMTIAVRRTRLLPGEMTIMRWAGERLSSAFSVAGPVLDVVFTGLLPPLLFSVMTAIVWWRWGRYPAFVFFLAGSVTGLTKVADLASRPRPTENLTWGEIVIGEGGYPSGHVVYTVMVFGMLAHLAAHQMRPALSRHALRGGALVLIVVTGPSRLVEVDHWPADVIAGYLIGIAGLAAAIWLDDHLPPVLANRMPRLHEWLHLTTTQSDDGIVIATAAQDGRVRSPGCVLEPRHAPPAPSSP